MNLSGSFVGLSVFKYEQPIPIKKSYNKIKVHGNAIIDKLHIRTTELSNNDLENMIITETQRWTPDTILLAEFENDLSEFEINLNAGNITTLINPVTEWRIWRKESNESVFKVLDTVDVSQIQYIDYTCQANKKYTYNIYPLTDSEIGQPMVSNELDTDFWGWYLIGNTNNITYVYMLDLNVDFGGYQNEEDLTEYETYGKYNAFAKGKRDFLRGSVSAIAGNISSNSNELLQSVDFIDELRNRIQDISTKTLKSRKGEIHRVKTHGFTATPLNNSISSQPYIVKFDFIQCEDI